MKIGVYCGSFAPVHKGHLTVIEQTLKEGLVDKIIVVPTCDYWNKKIAIPLEKRIACLKLFENEKITVDDNPAHCGAPSTFELMNMLKKDYPDDALTLMLGADNLLKFEKWVSSDFLIEHYPFIVMKRDETDIAEQMIRLGKKDYAVLECEGVDISSSWLREHSDEPKLLKEWMDERVVEILQKS